MCYTMKLFNWGLVFFSRMRCLDKARPLILPSVYTVHFVTPQYPCCDPASISMTLVIDLKYASLAEREDFDTVLGEVAQKGSGLQWAGHSHKNNSGIVKAAVQNDGLALQFAPHFQNDMSIVLAAVSQNGYALKFASEVLKM